MGSGIAGNWRAFAKQATIGETPTRKLKPGDVADMYLKPDGTGYTSRKTLLGTKQFDLTWRQVDYPGYEIVIPESGLTMYAELFPDGSLSTVWFSSIGAINRMGVFYKRF